MIKYRGTPEDIKFAADYGLDFSDLNLTTMTFAHLAEIIEGQMHGCILVGYDREERTAKWRVRVGGWPFVRGAGAGKTLDEAARRAFHSYAHCWNEHKTCIPTEEQLEELMNRSPRD